MIDEPVGEKYWREQCRVQQARVDELLVAIHFALGALEMGAISPNAAANAVTVSKARLKTVTGEVK